MKTVIELVGLIGGVALLFAIGWVITRVSGYSRIYDKMMDDGSPCIDHKIKGNIEENKTENKTENVEAMIHHVAI
jgi:hypothetical protein